MNRIESKLCIVCLLFTVAFLAGCNRSDQVSAEDRSPVATHLAETGDADQPAFPEAIARPVPGAADDVLVTVDGESITRGEAEAELVRMLQQSGQNIPREYLPQVMEQFLPQALETMIRRKLMQAAVADEDYEASETEIESILAEMIATLPEDVTLDAALSQQGVTEREVRDNIAEGLKMRRLTDRWTADIDPPSDAEVDTFYRGHPEHFTTPESVTARHILFRVDEDAEEAVRAEKMAAADAVREKLLAGADFEALAVEHSDCPSAQQGGLLGEFGRGDMVPEFEAAAFTLEPGTVSDIVATDFGYHLIRVESRAAASVTDLEDAEDSIREHLSRQRKQEVIETQIDALRDSARIEYANE